MPPVPARRRPARRNPATLINKRLVRSYLTKDGRQHAITKSAYHTLSHIGQKMLEKLIMKAKTEIQQTLSFHVRPATASGPSINTNHIKHAANCLQIPAEITEDAIDMSTRQAFDNTAFKRSNVRRLIQNYCGKARVRKDTIPLVWCIIVNLLGEVIEHSILPHQNVMKDGEAKNIRIKNEGVYNAIQNHPDRLLGPLKQFVGTGMNLGAR